MHLIQTGPWHLLKPKTVIGLGLLDNITLGLGTFQLEGTEDTSRSSHLSFLKTEDAAGWPSISRNFTPRTAHHLQFSQSQMPPAHRIWPAVDAEWCRRVTHFAESIHFPEFKRPSEKGYVLLPSICSDANTPGGSWSAPHGPFWPHQTISKLGGLECLQNS